MWLSVDPLAEKYPNISPYAYCLNNPIIYVDPDGRKVVNADRLRLEKHQTQLKNFKKSENYTKFDGLTRSEIKKAYGKSGIDDWQASKKHVSKLESEVSKYTSRAEKTDEIMVKWAKESPNLYAKVDEMSVDFYLGVDELVSSGEVGSPFGGTGIPTEVDGKYVYRVSDLDVENALPVYINRGVNIDSKDEETNEYSLNHEAGHFIFSVQNPKGHSDDRKKIPFTQYNGGHHPDARTGQNATKHGQLKDIEK
jgi:hypothetical protein